MAKDTAPIKFEFEKFFTGEVVATGYKCFFYPKTRKKKLKVIFKFSELFFNLSICNECAIDSPLTNGTTS